MPRRLPRGRAPAGEPGSTRPAWATRLRSAPRLRPARSRRRARPPASGPTRACRGRSAPAGARPLPPRPRLGPATPQARRSAFPRRPHGRRRFRRASRPLLASKLTLRELGPLSRLLEPRLATLLGARVTGEHPAAHQLSAELGVDLDQSTRDAMADRIGLARDAAPVDADGHVDLAVVA